MNAPLPWFGAGSLTQELNQDGTLSKATSTPDTKMEGGITSLIPFKEYLTGRFVQDLKDETPANALNAVTPEGIIWLESVRRRAFQISRDKKDVQVVYVLSLSTEEIGQEYTFTKIHKPEPISPTPIPFDTAKQTFSRRDRDSRHNLRN